MFYSWGPSADDAIEKHNSVAKLASPTDEQRKNLAEYVTDDDLNGGRCAFRSAEMVNAQAYAPRQLHDLILFEAPGSAMGRPVDRWFVEPVMRTVEWMWMGRQVRITLLHLPYPVTSCEWDRVLQTSKRLVNSHLVICSDSSDQRTVQEDLEAGLPPEHRSGRATEESREKRASQQLTPLYSVSTRPHKMLNKATCAFISVIFPCAAVTSLNAVSNQNTRVWMVCVFAIVFSIGMSLSSRARRIEVFAVTAA